MCVNDILTIFYSLLIITDLRNYIHLCQQSLEFMEKKQVILKRENTNKLFAFFIKLINFSKN